MEALTGRAVKNDLNVLQAEMHDEPQEDHHSGNDGTVRCLHGM